MPSTLATSLIMPSNSAAVWGIAVMGLVGSHMGLIVGEIVTFWLIVGDLQMKSSVKSW